MDFAAIVVLEILYMIAFLALISAGLAIVFGMMRVINLAHGEFVMLGGYATIAAAKHGINIYFAMLVISPIVVGIIGLIVERLIVRFLYGRMIDVMLATWGLSLLLVGLVTLIFGNTAVSVPAPIPGYRIGALPDGRLQPLRHRRRRPPDVRDVACASLHARRARGARRHAGSRGGGRPRLQSEHRLYADVHGRRGAFGTGRQG